MHSFLKSFLFYSVEFQARKEIHDESLCVNLYPKLLALRFRVTVKGMKDRWDHYSKYLLPAARYRAGRHSRKIQSRRIYPFVVHVAYVGRDINC